MSYISLRVLYFSAPVNFQGKSLPTPYQKTFRGWEFFLGLVDPSRNGLVSTAYFAKPGFSVLHAWMGIQKYIYIFSRVVKFT